MQRNYTQYYKIATENQVGLSSCARVSANNRQQSCFITSHTDDEIYIGATMETYTIIIIQLVTNIIRGRKQHTSSVVI